MSRRKSNRSARAALLRSMMLTAVVAMSGCAYFHPAFVTHPTSALERERANGVMVCERVSLRTEKCGVVPRSAVRELLDEQRSRY